MSITLNIELNDRDLEHLQSAMAAAQKAVAGKSDAEVVDCASRLLVEAQKGTLPDFIVQRLVRLDDMIAMVRDEAWAMDAEDRSRVISALAYFCDPDDVIPDNVAVLGLLDDAIMIELAARELQPELDAYDEFCDFRQHQAERLGQQADKVGLAGWLGTRRDELVERMHRRRGERGVGSGYGSSSGYASGRTYVRAWRPGMFKFR